MKHLNQQKPTAIQAEDIASVAQRGVERALAARQNMMELSSEQVKDISGGALSIFKGPIINGGRIIDIYSRLPQVSFGNISIPNLSFKF